MRPKFDPKEEFIIAYYRQESSSGAGRNWIYDIVILLIGAVLFVVGTFGASDPTWSIIGFGLVAYRVVHLALSSPNYDGVFGRIICKYESALESAEDKGEARNTKAEQDAPSNH